MPITSILLVIKSDIGSLVRISVTADGKQADKLTAGIILLLLIISLFFLLRTG